MNENTSSRGIVGRAGLWARPSVVVCRPEVTDSSSDSQGIGRVPSAELASRVTLRCCLLLPSRRRLRGLERRGTSGRGEKGGRTSECPATEVIAFAAAPPAPPSASPGATFSTPAFAGWVLRGELAWRSGSRSYEKQSAGGPAHSERLHTHSVRPLTLPSFRSSIFVLADSRAGERVERCEAAVAFL